MYILPACLARSHLFCYSELTVFSSLNDVYLPKIQRVSNNFKWNNTQLKFKPRTVEKNESTIGPPAEMEPTLLRSRWVALTTVRATFRIYPPSSVMPQNRNWLTHFYFQALLSLNTHPASYLCSSVARALHGNRRKSVVLIPAGGPIVDSFFSTPPGLNLSWVWFYSKLRPFEPLEFILHRMKCHKIINLYLRFIFCCSRCSKVMNGNDEELTELCQCLPTYTLPTLYRKWLLLDLGKKISWLIT